MRTWLTGSSGPIEVNGGRATRDSQQKTGGQTAIIIIAEVLLKGDTPGSN